MKVPGRKIVIVITAILAAFCSCGARAFPFLGDEAGRDPGEMIRLDTYPVTIEYEKSNEKVARYVADICRDALPGLSSQLGLDAVTPVKVVIVPRMDMYRSAGGPDFPEWGAAFALMGRQVMIVDVEKAVRTWNSLDKTVTHELSHLLLAQRVHDVPMPAWFLEGLAQWQAGQGSMTDSWHLMNAVWNGTVPTLMEITIQFPAGAAEARNAYRISLAAFKDIFSDGHGPVAERLPRFLDEINARGEFDAALAAFRGEDLHRFSASFMEGLRRRYTTHLLLFQDGPLFSMMALFFVVMIVVVRLRSRRRMRRFEMEERGL